MRIKLNILPEYKKKEIRNRSVFLKLMRWNFEFSAVYMLFILTLFAVSYILELNLQANLLQLNQANTTKFEEFQMYNKKIKETNSSISQVIKIQNGQLNWTKFFSKIEVITPEGVTISGIATKDFSILLTGDSNSRDNLLLMKDNISNEECFDEVNLPLSYLVPKENLDFQMTFSLKRECLR